jgi:hypothetical protein
MKVQNLTNDRGNKVNNQFIIFDSEFTMFKSYNSNIVKTVFEEGKRVTYLDSYYWNYSRTTAKYRNQFLGESTKEIESKIKNGTYLLTNLNN